MNEQKDDLLASLQQAHSQEQLLWEITRRSLAKLPPAVEDAAYRCAVVHWFNPDVLQAILGSERLSHMSSRPLEPAPDVASIYAQLQSLSFVEVFPERGYNFHALTREAILNYLWRKEPDFFRAVSEQAADYYGRNFDTEEGAGWDEVIEWTYHLLIADEESAVEQIDLLMSDLATNGLGGYCDALVQVVAEHARADRLARETQMLLQYWEIIAAYVNNKHSDVKQIANELLLADDDYVSPLLKVHVRSYLAESQRLMGDYGDAEDSYDFVLEQLVSLDPLPQLELEALRGLGHIAVAQGRYDEAEDLYKLALETAVRQLVLVPYEDDEGNVQQSFGLFEDEDLPQGTQLFNPERWYSWFDLGLETAVDEERPDDAEAAPAEAPDELDEFNDEDGEPVTAPPLPLYLIEIGDDEEPRDAESGENEVVIIAASLELAELWLSLGYLYHNLSRYDLSAAATRLSGRIFADLDSASGLQRSAELLFNLGVSTLDKEMMELSTQFQRQLLEMALEAEDPATELGALLGLSGIYWNQSDYGLACETYTSALALARELEDPSSIAVALDNLANLDLIFGDVDSARKRAVEALNLYREIGYREGEARLLMTLGRAELTDHQLRRAADHYRSALEMFRELRVPSGETQVHQGLGDVARLEGRFDDAREHFQKALKIARRLHTPSDEIAALMALARLHGTRNEYESARELYTDARSIAQSTGQAAAEAEILRDVGFVAVTQKQYDEARELFERAEEIYARLNQAAGRLDVLFGRIYLLQMQQKREEVAETAVAALELAERLGDRAQMIQALLALYDARKLQGEFDQLLEILDRALALDPNAPDVLATKGDLLCEFAEYEAANDALEAANQLDSGSSWAYQMQGWALANLGPSRAAECLRVYETAANIQPDNLWAHKGIAEAYHLMGDETRAAEKYRWVIEQLRELPPDKEDPALQAWCHYRLGEFATAVELYARLLQESEDEPLFNQFDYALSLLCGGSHARALEEYQRGIEFVEERQALGRRGLLFVAIDDLEEAMARQPEIAASPEAQTVLRDLKAAWTAAHA